MSVRGRQLAEEEAKKYINRNLTLFHRVQVSQMIHLPCLTETDRQKIRARYTNEGNNETIFFFFQSLCCKTGWVLPFVEGLREQNMGDLADELERLYRSRLLPASAPPAANRPSAPPLRPDANEQRPPGQCLAEKQALPFSPSQLAASSANPPPQEAGDYRTPVQENSHPAEKSRLAVHPKTTDKEAKPGSSSTSEVSSASNIGAAVGGDRGIESPDPDPVWASVPCPVEKRPLPSQTISTPAEGNVENWDGRQHRPVTVKNGCFGNAHRPEDSGTGSALPTGASSNQPEEDYYSSDSISLALGGPREDSAAERKVLVLRGDQKRENPPVVDSLQSRLDSPRKNPPASHGSPENQTQPFMDPSSRRPPANDAQLRLTQTRTKPPLLVPNPGPEHLIRLPPSDLDGSSSTETKAPKPCQEVSAAGGAKPSDDFKLPVEDKRSSGEITGTGTLAGRPQRAMETRPSAARDHKRDSNIFQNNCSDNDMPSKPGVLSSVPAAKPSKIHSNGAGETNDMYSGSSGRLRMSDTDSISVSTSDSDPILISESSSVGHSTTHGRNRPSGAVDATLPPEVDAGEEDTSFRSYHLLVEKNPSMDLTEAPLDVASSRPSPRDFLDSTSQGQPENKAKNHQVGPSLPDEKVGFENVASPGNFWMLFVAFSAAFLAYVLYKKK